MLGVTAVSGAIYLLFPPITMMVVHVVLGLIGNALYYEHLLSQGYTEVILNEHEEVTHET